MGKFQTDSLLRDDVLQVKYISLVLLHRSPSDVNLVEHTPTVYVWYKVQT